METTRKWPQPHLRSRCPALLQNCFWRAHREPMGPATPPSSRPPQPLAGGQSEGHFALCHWLRAQSPWLACAPGVAEPTKIQATPGFQPRLPRPVLSLRERKATMPGSPVQASEAGLRGGGRTSGACALAAWEPWVLCSGNRRLGKCAPATWTEVSLCTPPQPHPSATGWEPEAIPLLEVPLVTGPNSRVWGSSTEATGVQTNKQKSWPKPQACQIRYF